ncbi:hypothetical protein AB1L30_18005 [Bremerella sp. JC817]|uniref:hypothetical protein n=1 Tax=Bremerella sp. JC817 TaxID=3231756 RepID=UPI003457D475
MADEQQDLTNEIADAANKPRQVTVDGVTVQGHSIPDLVAADKYLSQKKAIKKRGFFSARQMVPPGTAG